jgi:predicted nucleic-acid-binding Zn-ribbon protein
MEETKKCPKCGGEMEEGVIGGLEGLRKWGKKGSDSVWDGNVKDGKEVVVFRCKVCGYLESYAK